RFWSMPGPVTALPHSQMVPASTGSSRLAQRSSVDLPEPEAPIRHTTSWVATDRSTPLSTSFGPNDLRSPSILIASAPSGLASPAPSGRVSPAPPFCPLMSSPRPAAAGGHPPSHRPAPPPPRPAGAAPGLPPPATL